MPMASCARRKYGWPRTDQQVGHGNFPLTEAPDIISETEQELRIKYEVANRAVKLLLEKEQRRSASQRSVQREFAFHAEAWRRETRVLSSVQAKIFNRHYQRIMAMGPNALRLIFSELKERGGHWYWALECITGDNPASDAKTITDAKIAWLQYGVQRGYL
jgi:hypothetical protein